MFNLVITLTNPLIAFPDFSEFLVGTLNFNNHIVILCAMRDEWAAFLWTLMHAPAGLLTVTLVGEELLA